MYTFTCDPCVKKTINSMKNDYFLHRQGQFQYHTKVLPVLGEAQFEGLDCCWEPWEQLSWEDGA